MAASRSGRHGRHRRRRIVANRGMAASRSARPIEHAKGQIVANRGMAASRSSRPITSIGPRNCSKPRNGRKPQPAGRLGHLAPHCSKPRNGRKPQPGSTVCSPRRRSVVKRETAASRSRGGDGMPHAGECSETRDGRKPQQPGANKNCWSECSETRRRPQAAAIGELVKTLRYSVANRGMAASRSKVVMPCWCRRV